MPGSALYANSPFRDIYNWVGQVLPEGFCWLAYFLAGFIVMFAVVNVFMIMAALYVWAERRLLGRFQSRRGPNRWGPFGILQPFADMIKLLLKEDIVPSVADRVVFGLAPLVAVAPVLLLLVVIPFGKNSFIANVNVALLYLVAVTSVGTLAILMAGWSSGNKYALFGAMRGVAQLISYEIPLVVALGSVALLAGSMSLVDIVEAQHIPFLLVQPLAVLIFYAAISSELNRSPFDLTEAESEIIAGYHTEYSGVKFSLFQLAEFAGVLTASAIMATVFLQGWRWAVLPSHLWFLLKLFFFTFIFIWVRASWPRLRIDQIMGFAWKFLLPLSLINLVVTAVEVYVWPEVTIRQLWLMAAINWGVALVAVLGLAVLQVQRVPRPMPLPTDRPRVPAQEVR
ncbi:MAG: NADH-quinone oxidoreductase subunit NuoH [Dehalococcoidia bacterium]